MIKIYLDTETVSLPEKVSSKTDDLIIQLTYIVENNGTYVFQNEYCNPKLPISVGSMALTGIVPEMIENKPKCKDTTAFHNLQKLIDNNDCVIYAHNALVFDIEMLKRAGLDLKETKIIDTLKLCRFINDNQNMIWEETNLQYLIYYYRLDKYREKLARTVGCSKEVLNSHDAMLDVIDLMLLTKHLERMTNADVNIMIELCSKPIFYKHFPYGKNRGKLLSEMDPSILIWWYENSNDEDLKFTINKMGN